MVSRLKTKQTPKHAVNVNSDHSQFFTESESLSLVVKLGQKFHSLQLKKINIHEYKEDESIPQLK